MVEIIQFPYLKKKREREREKKKKEITKKQISSPLAS